MMRSVIPADELLTKARAIGQYYGFIPLASLTAPARHRVTPVGEVVPGPVATKLPVTLPESLVLDPTAEIMVSFLKQFRGALQIPNPRQPLFVWHTNITPGRPAPKKAIIQFHALGADRALADAVVIRALLALARDLFHEDFSVRVNSMGDRETRARYARELGNYFRKHASTLPENCVACSKLDLLEAAELAIAHASVDDLPAPLEHLSDASRKRFEDLLEYLEMTETPYELARDLLSKGGAWSDACFEVIAGETRIAWGSRYSDPTRPLFPPPPLPAARARVTGDRRRVHRRYRGSREGGGTEPHALLLHPHRRRGQAALYPARRRVPSRASAAFAAHRYRIFDRTAPPRRAPRLPVPPHHGPQGGPREHGDTAQSPDPGGHHPPARGPRRAPPHRRLNSVLPCRSMVAEHTT